tara:strand:- start:145 stop:579 length:435 start_codon:yes stop_codon:yes gene_type:complete
MSLIGISNDHGGFDLKNFIIKSFPTLDFMDLGTSSSESVHYPTFADHLCKKILDGSINQGILICGTGIGISMRANRYPGIRAAVVHDIFTSEMAKAHNNANIICLGGRTTSNEAAISYIEKWLSTSFESGRHQTRIDMLDEPIK